MARAQMRGDISVEGILGAALYFTVDTAPNRSLNVSPNTAFYIAIDAT